MQTVRAPKTTCRPLVPADLDRVVAIDAALEGRSRREYFARRLRAAVHQPKQHVQLAALGSEGLAGFVLARVLRGEFGRAQAALRLEAIGVRQDARGGGIGGELFESLLEWTCAHDVEEVRTQVAWNRHEMLRWLDGLGFELAPACVVDMAVTPREPEGDGNDRDRVDVRSMQPADLRDIVRIDRELTGRERAAYVAGKLDETVADSAIRVSLTARVDGTVAGYLAARVDLGDFGRVEPVAVLDTIGVDPAFARRGVGRALLYQLVQNLSALRIERIETLVAPRDFGLLGFLSAAGFAPSQRLPFVHRARSSPP
jgi:ribosomal protein S18 acetylase RimI-like enzyme